MSQSNASKVFLNLEIKSISGRCLVGFGPALAVCFAESSSFRCQCAIYEGEAHALEVAAVAFGASYIYVAKVLRFLWKAQAQSKPKSASYFG